METVNCPLCGGTQWTPLIEAEDPDSAPPRPAFTVVRCPACSLCFTNPRPAAEEIGRFYAADYVPHQMPVLPITWRDRLKIKLRGWLPIFTPDYERGDFPPLGRKRVLDFGCGGGAFCCG